MFGVSCQQCILRVCERESLKSVQFRRCILEYVNQPSECICCELFFLSLPFFQLVSFLSPFVSLMCVHILLTKRLLADIVLVSPSLSLSLRVLVFAVFFFCCCRCTPCADAICMYSDVQQTHGGFVHNYDSCNKFFPRKHNACVKKISRI